MEDISADLERFDRDFKPGSGQKPGLSMLADGEYDFRIVKAETARTEKKRDPIVRIVLQVLTKGNHYGTTLERVYFLGTLENTEILGADLVTLGIDADQWAAQGRKFSVELAPALLKIVGVCFMGKKTTKKTDKATYHNLFINERIAPPATFPGLPSSGDKTPQPVAEKEEETEIPF